MPADGRAASGSRRRRSCGSRQAAPDRSRRGSWQRPEDHVTWTRLYIISALAGLPDTATTATRLLNNPSDIGGAVAAHHGDGGAGD